MESASFMSFVSQVENRLGEVFRKGQRDVAERFLNSTSVTAQLPTGYGKTRAAALSYAVLRATQMANRVLYVVPRGGLPRRVCHERKLNALLKTV
jgi:superfamily II DNA or RNA helicase